MQKNSDLLVINIISKCFGQLYAHRQEIVLRSTAYSSLSCCSCCDAGESVGKMCALCGECCLTGDSGESVGKMCALCGDCCLTGDTGESVGKMCALCG